MNTLHILTWFSAISFVYFGYGCFYSKFIIKEFVRYGIPKFRKLTGSLQLLGATGLIVGLYYGNLLWLLAAAGLCALMFSGFIVRLKINDPFFKSMPSLVYALINLWIVYLLFPLI